jgi:ABC-2 type transport system permease protein
MSGLGIASAGCVLVSKEGEPVSWLFGAASALLGGVYFPVDLMPSWLSHLSVLLPTTHAMMLIRPGNPGSDTPLQSLLFLATAATVSVALGLLVLDLGHRVARARGSLGQY